MQHDPVAVARAGYRAFVDKDRAAIEAVIADDFHFTSPFDNRIDRATYFARCWPSSTAIAGFDFIHVVSDGNRVFVTYEAQSAKGRRFRNSEILTIRDGKIVEVEVYFGWRSRTRLPKAASSLPKTRVATRIINVVKGHQPPRLRRDVEAAGDDRLRQSDVSAATQWPSRIDSQSRGYPAGRRMKKPAKAGFSCLGVRSRSRQYLETTGGGGGGGGGLNK